MLVSIWLLICPPATSTRPSLSAVAVKRVRLELIAPVAVQAPVAVPEYVLLSEELYRSIDSTLPSPAEEVAQELEGVGPARSYAMDIGEPARSLPPPPGPSLGGRVGRTLSVAAAGMPYMLGLRRRRHRVAVG